MDAVSQVGYDCVRGGQSLCCIYRLFLGVWLAIRWGSGSIGDAGSYITNDHQCHLACWIKKKHQANRLGAFFGAAIQIRTGDLILTNYFRESFYMV